MECKIEVAPPSSLTPRRHVKNSSSVASTRPPGSYDVPQVESPMGTRAGTRRG